MAFAASRAESLYPNYVAFSRVERWGDAAPLGRALDAVWDGLVGDVPSAQLVEELVRSVEAVAPDTERFTSLFVGPALDAVIAVARALECYVDDGPSSAATAAQVAVDAIDAYVNMVDHPSPTGHVQSSMADAVGRDGNSTSVQALKREQEQFDEWVRRHPLMTAELRAQRQDIEALARSQVLDPELVKRLREAARRRGIQPFARGFFSERVP